jgi:leader peptidase (prepilin peptidase)/N-methyltransferase
MEAEVVAAASEVTPEADLGAAEGPAPVYAVRRPKASPAQRVAPVALALAFAGLAFNGHRSVAGVLIAGFAAVVLVVLAAIDIERRTIPNRIVVPAAAAVLVGRIVEYPHGWAEFVLASLGAAVLLFLPSVFNRAAIGMGDVKLGLLLGAALGWTALDAILIALLFAAPVSATILIRGRRAARRATIPLAPFFAVGALVAVLIMPRL